MYGFHSSENQETMTLAFLISAHTDPIHLARLLKSLPEDAAFFIHIDSKTDITLSFHSAKTHGYICSADG